MPFLKIQHWLHMQWLHRHQEQIGGSTPGCLGNRGTHLRGDRRLKHRLPGHVTFLWCHLTSSLLHRLSSRNRENSFVSADRHLMLDDVIDEVTWLLSDITWRNSPLPYSSTTVGCTTVCCVPRRDLTMGYWWWGTGYMRARTIGWSRTGTPATVCSGLYGDLNPLSFCDIQVFQYPSIHIIMTPTLGISPKSSIPSQ